MGWRVAKSLLQLKAQIDAAYPGRSKVSDGTKGDDAHASRKSDHNPNKSGVVCALDITNDPAHGIDSFVIAEAIRLSGDKRIKYLISNGKISNPDIAGGQWRKYTGKNPHNHHFHISVRGDVDSTEPWAINATTSARATIATAPTLPSRPNLRRGMSGSFVKSLQETLGIPADGDFGPKTEAAVKTFQKKHKLVADGKVGPYTWDALNG